VKKLLAPLAGVGLMIGLVAGASPALANQPGTTSDQVVGVVRLLSPTTALVQARYTCTQGTEEQMHLWVSVKQTAGGTADPRLAEEGSSSIATAWSQSHAGVADLVCNGRTHVGRFLVDQTEQGFGTLQRGDAYVQFCLFDATTTTEPVSSMEFVHVR
jgi:hypothetical protein